MEEESKIANEFAKENEDVLALLGLVGISMGDLEDKDGLFTQFAQYCKDNGVSKKEAFKALMELVNETE